MQSISNRRTGVLGKDARTLEGGGVLGEAGGVGDPGRAGVGPELRWSGDRS